MLRKGRGTMKIKIEMTMRITMTERTTKKIFCCVEFRECYIRYDYIYKTSNNCNDYYDDA